MSESKYNVENVNLPYYEQTKNYPKIKINFIFSLQVYGMEGACNERKRKKKP